MKTLTTFFTILILMLTCFNLYAQDRLVAKRIDSLSLDYYLEDPTYLINKNYVVFEYKQTRKIIYADMSSFKIPRYSVESGVACDKNGVYFQGDLLKIDTSGLRLISGAGDYGSDKVFWKTNEKVFENATEHSDFDAKTFQSIGSGYFRDKNYVYYYDAKMAGSDPGTISRTDNPMVYYDKNNCYNKGKIIYYHDQKLSPANYTLGKAQNEVIANYAFIDHYYANRQTKAVSSIDAPTLRGLSRYYSVDKRHVYYDTIALPIKPKNFKHIKVWDQLNSAYISDGINVYYRADKIETNIDVKSFGMLPHADLCYDKNGVYDRKWLQDENKAVYERLPFKYKEPVTAKNTFVTKNYRYVIYTNQACDRPAGPLYLNLKKDEIEALNSGKFFLPDKKVFAEYLEAGFIKAGDKLFYNNHELRNFNANPMVGIGYDYLKDNDYVYHLRLPSEEDKKIKLDTLHGSDPSTFTCFTNGFYKDKSSLYFNIHKLINSDDIQLLAIYQGLRESGDEGDGLFSNYCLFKNKDGYWLVETLPVPVVDYLGKTFDRKWNKAFKKLELPAGL